MLIIFTESVLLYHFKGFILEIKHDNTKERSFTVLLCYIGTQTVDMNPEN